MKILITGSDGFIAKNLIQHLKQSDIHHLYLFNKKDSMDILESFVKEADFIFHLAGVNRPENPSEFYEGNSELTQKIVNILRIQKKKTPILLSSSMQALLDNDYGKSKLQAENTLIAYAQDTGASVFIYRLQNVFGKWSRPNYNSVVATWCYNVSHDIELQINDENKELTLIYIDDIVDSFIENIENQSTQKYYEISPVYKYTLLEIKELLYRFKANRNTLLIPNVGSGFERALYATYLSYLPSDRFSYELEGHEDSRGTFYEILKTLDSGQFSLSTTAPGITRGGHYHHTKNEKFLVVKGDAVIEFRHVVTSEKISYKVNGKKMQVVEMIPGYTHNITNVGDDELILVLWANEVYDNNNPDTYMLEV